MRATIKTWFLVLRTSAKEFHLDHAAKLSASPAYCAVFSLGPLVFVIISLTGLFFEHRVETAKLWTLHI